MTTKREAHTIARVTTVKSAIEFVEHVDAEAPWLIARKYSTLKANLTWLLGELERLDERSPSGKGERN